MIARPTPRQVKHAAQQDGWHLSDQQLGKRRTDAKLGSSEQGIKDAGVQVNSMTMALNTVKVVFYG